MEVGGVNRQHKGKEGEHSPLPRKGLEPKMGFSPKEGSFPLNPQNNSPTETDTTGDFPTETRVTAPS